MSYVNLESGIIHVESDITWENTIPFLATLREMDMNKNFDSITVHISSSGGTNAATLSICQALRTCEKTVRTIGTGSVSSAAVYILAAGTPGHRYVIEGSLLMLHGAQLHTKAGQVDTMSLSELKTYTTQVEARLMHLAREISRYTNTPEDVWVDRITNKNEWYFEPGEAIKLGIADHVIQQRYGGS